MNSMDEKIFDVLADATYVCAYWAGSVDYDHTKLTKGKKFECFEEKLLDCLKNGGTVTYFDIEDGTPYEVTYEKMQNGISKLLKKHKGNWEKLVDYSDQILQFCIFGEIVFG